MSRWSDLAAWVGPTPNEGGAMTEARGLVLHIQEGSQAGSLAWSRNPDSQVSAHFYAAKDGSVAQLVDTAVVAWTQAAGNGHWLSVECEGYHTDALTAEQVESVAQLYARGVALYGWPLSSTDSTSGRGLGWHGMGGAAWGGHPDCPGDHVKAQRPAILARAAQILGGGPAGGTVEDDEMTNDDMQKLANLTAERTALLLARGYNDVGENGGNPIVADHLPGFTVADVLAKLAQGGTGGAGPAIPAEVAALVKAAAAAMGALATKLGA